MVIEILRGEAEPWEFLDVCDTNNEYQEYHFIRNCSLETQFPKYSEENNFLLQELVVRQDGNLGRNLPKLQGDLGWYPAYF